MDAVLARRPNAKGAANLRAVMSGEARVSLSRLESRFLALLREHGLPLPVTNRPAGGRRVDCRWPERRLTVELDSYGFHNSRHSWERDHRREREAYARGDQFRRYTWGDVFEQPGPMLAELLELLLLGPVGALGQQLGGLGRGGAGAVGARPLSLPRPAATLAPRSASTLAQ